ncbi:hypothetical protein [Pseudoalteromonas luteoviolacea]|uniref:Uncharacterized protein n=1 Tax=Pseudoalteromonas luteoviolacea S4060-1 TaxID=1365257 RepID=A0A167L743_9GAMM|nr:hypothetical protein [Pseudoalteromonas luteoviolacea]KZN63925.1 hypothetical protein N478_23545 [Pseudoalteromonas luteoviolacea S4060-1]
MWFAIIWLLIGVVHLQVWGSELKLSGPDRSIIISPEMSNYSICRGYRIEKSRGSITLLAQLYGFDSCEGKDNKQPLVARNLTDNDQPKILALANYFGIYHAPNKLGLRFEVKFSQQRAKIDWFVEQKKAETTVKIDKSFNREMIRVTFLSDHKSASPKLELLLYVRPQTNEIVKVEIITKKA